MSNIFIFDTNALISAHLMPNSVSRQAYNNALRKGVIVYSEETLSEFIDVLTRPKFDKYLFLEDRLNAIHSFETNAQAINVTENVTDCRDPKDNKFLELAISANASAIITGDKDLLVLHPFRNIPIVNATDFLLLF